MPRLILAVATVFVASSRWIENMKFSEYGVLLRVPKNGSALTGRYCGQLTPVTGLPFQTTDLR